MKSWKIWYRVCHEAASNTILMCRHLINVPALPQFKSRLRTFLCVQAFQQNQVLWKKRWHVCLWPVECRQMHMDRERAGLGVGGWGMGAWDWEIQTRVIYYYYYYGVCMLTETLHVDGDVKHTKVRSMLESVNFVTWMATACNDIVLSWFCTNSYRQESDTTLRRADVIIHVIPNDCNTFCICMLHCKTPKLLALVHSVATVVSWSHKERWILLLLPSRPGWFKKIIF